MGNPNVADCAASKAGVIDFNKVPGEERANLEFRVNRVSPAAVRTPTFDQMSEAHIAFVLGKIPHGRFGTTEEIAALVCWLASGKASFTTAAVFECSGGWATYKDNNAGLSFTALFSIFSIETMLLTTNVCRWILEDRNTDYQEHIGFQRPQHTIH